MPKQAKRVVVAEHHDIYELFNTINRDLLCEKVEFISFSGLKKKEEKESLTQKVENLR